MRYKPVYETRYLQTNMGITYASYLKLRKYQPDLKDCPFCWGRNINFIEKDKFDADGAECLDCGKIICEPKKAVYSPV